MTGIHQAVLAAGKKPVAFYEILLASGLANLNQVFDAADSRSYDGSSQTWTDIVGTANYQRGSAAGADGNDPTFNGTIGDWSDATYFSFDGADYFSQTAGQTYLDNWIKDNGQGTVIAVLRSPASGANQMVFDADSATNNCVFYFQTAGNMQAIHVTSNIGVQQTVTSSGLTVTASTLHFMAWTFDEATTVMDFYLNGSTNQQTFNASTRTNNRTGTQTWIGTNTSGFFASGTRLMCFATASSYMTSAQKDSIYNALKERRFTALP